MLTSCSSIPSGQNQGSAKLSTTPEQAAPFIDMLEEMFDKPYDQITQQDLDRIKGVYVDGFWSNLYYTLDDTNLKIDDLTPNFVINNVIFNKWKRIEYTSVDGLEDFLKANPSIFSQFGNLEFMTFTNVPGCKLSLSGLPNLWYLDISETDIVDLSGLTDLKGLQYLKATSNNISDLKPLASLSELRSLYLYNNNIIDITALRGLANLQVVYLSQNYISDISVLKDLQNLADLSLVKNNIRDISALKDLSNLRILNLSDNQINTIDALADKPNLETLYLAHNEISHPNAAATFPVTLNTLDLSYNNIQDLYALGQMAVNTSSLITPEHHGLVTLNVANNLLTSFSYLSGFKNLQTIDLSGNMITDLSLVVDLPVTVTSLNFEDNIIRDITPLEKFATKASGQSTVGQTGLETLNLSHNHISKLDALAKFQRIKNLNLARNDITYITALFHLKMEYLDLSYNQIEDISPLHIDTNSEPVKVDFPILLKGTPFADLRLLIPGN
jgi:Leucine-rich repeat (LRR) protein